jgi:signal transduction histidine kinase
VKHLVRVLDEILLVGKLESGKFQLNLETTNLTQICRNLINEMQDSLGINHELVFNHDQLELTVDVDIVLFKCALANLLSNAIKYSPEGSLVELNLNCVQDIATLTVSDSGIGIPESERAKLFSPFYRGSNVTNVQGTGLGLVLVKEVVELHHGTIACESQLNQGTSITISIPLHRNPD